MSEARKVEIDDIEYWEKKYYEYIETIEQIRFVDDVILFDRFICLAYGCLHMSIRCREVKIIDDHGML